MAIPFRWGRSWIISDWNYQRFVVWLGYGHHFTLFAKQGSGSIVTITVMHYCQEGQISSTNVVLTNNTHTKIFDENHPHGTHLVLKVSRAVGTPGIEFYAYGLN